MKQYIHCRQTKHTTHYQIVIINFYVFMCQLNLRKIDTFKPLMGQHETVMQCMKKWGLQTFAVFPKTPFTCSFIFPMNLWETDTMPLRSLGLIWSNYILSSSITSSKCYYISILKTYLMASNAHGPITYVKMLNPQENSQPTKRLSNNYK